jgi:hypothetical protein
MSPNGPQGVISANQLYSSSVQLRRFDSINLAKGYQHGRRVVQLTQAFQLALPKDTKTADVLSNQVERFDSINLAKGHQGGRRVVQSSRALSDIR